MRIPYIGLFIILLINGFIDYQLYRYLKKALKNPIWSKMQLVSAIIFAFGLIILFFIPLKTASDEMMRVLMWVIFAYISVYGPKYIFVLINALASLPRLWHRERIRFITRAGGALSILLFLCLWWGALVNRFNIDIKDVNVEITDLPPAFDDFRIVQISDLHVGTYGTDTAFIAKLADKINRLKPDLILFTGDIVNRHSKELEPFVTPLSHLKAKYGVYSILGNHDYGDYFNWKDSTERATNNECLYELQAKMGWKLLRNSYENIKIRNDSLVIIGVENIGDPPFHIYGDLRKAYPTPTDNTTKILMSHNPAHWVNDIANTDKNIALTLSGHTHAMQIMLFGFSPASLRYRTWGGLYQDDSRRHQLYVNIGTGTVGFPARIGATPEVTLITLHGKKQ